MPIRKQDEEPRLRHVEASLPFENMCDEEGEGFSGPHAGDMEEFGDSVGSGRSAGLAAARQLLDGVGDVDFHEQRRNKRRECQTRTCWKMLMVFLTWTAVVYMLRLPNTLAKPVDIEEEEDEGLSYDAYGSSGRSLNRTKREYVSDSEQRYLINFGYLPASDLETGNLRSGKQLEEAIKEMQAFAGLKPTGKIDKATKKLLKTPRCGVQDQYPDDGRRKKRYVLRGPKWGYTNLTWRLRIPPTIKTRSLDPISVQHELKEALEIWAEDSKLTFEMVDHDDADILIEFSRGYHGDGFPFDGKGKILAHAFFPSSGRGGDAHFDDDEVWLMKSESQGKDEEYGTSLFAVAAHEFGHSLGLAHSSTEGALMYPWYQGSMSQEGKYKLPDDDRYGIQQLYGMKDENRWATRRPWTPPSTTTTQRPWTPPRHQPGHQPEHQPGHRHPTTHKPHYAPTHKPNNEEPDACNTNYDAISLLRGELFIFKDKYVWRLGRNGLEKNAPTLITRYWNGLPHDFTHVDAVYERTDGKIVFFVGRKFYVFNPTNLVDGYPQPLTHLGLPDSLEKIDGAMVWGHNSKAYLFSGTMYWRLEEHTGRVELDYPRDMRMWRGVGYNIDCVFKYIDGITYFFKGKGFWAFDDRKMRVKNKVQKSSAIHWMHCPKDENILRPSQDYELEDRHGISSASLPCRTFSIIVILIQIACHLYHR